MKPFRVLVVDDSKFMRKIISDLIEKDSRFMVAGTARNGREALEQVKSLEPDLITMDVEMPEMNGLEALQSIMQDQPTPVIMLSGINEQGMKETIIALEYGAFDFIRKPSITNAQDIDSVGRELIKQLSAAIQAKERRALWEEEEQRKQLERLIPDPSFTSRRERTELSKPAANLMDYKSESLTQRPVPSQASKLETDKSLSKESRDSITLPKPSGGKQKRHTHRSDGPQISETKSLNGMTTKSTVMSQLVAVGCSTGGPRALRTLLENLPENFPAPVVIVQHMPPNFTKSLAARLNSFSQLEVMEAAHGMVLRKGCAYIAPGGRHISLDRSQNGDIVILVTQEEPRNGHRPSVEVLFESLLPFEHIKRHLILMTGMGSDGARAMKKLYDAGVTSTFAESEETCVVYGMPRSAVELGCVSYILPLQEISAKLVQSVINEK
ncbi:protein-glutamate methylesterase/protein-glutamine glutaminase [Paenibacillus lemnae]|uniref:Protein-glutamate methylesterase/protein-glutamine glutaminase n=1 Tax=Paenibacillus lemnae TaxID=1330551 RepID=A0A848M5E8_PAELE|nr:chemotaxis response regulator protein-glutamate methylesterase [Paenibacillus lemnae]NMO96177.1 chemotaxis response regulator protein-glutamate methylesterase [Paenibacillus lemnae]